MPVTKLNDVINPEVMADMIEAKITAQAKLMPYAKVDDTLEGVPGDTITVPSWNYIGDAEDFDVEGASDNDGEIPVTKLTAGSTTFTVKCAAKSVGILQTAINSGFGNPIGQASSQLAKSIIGKVDNDLMTACEGVSARFSAGAIVGYAKIVEAVGQFLDEEDGIDKVMFINPAQETTLLKDSDFLSADKFTAGVAVHGAIGKIAGCWIKKSAKVRKFSYEKDNTNGTITIVSDATTESATNKHLGTIQPYCEDVLAVGNKVKVVTDYYLNPIIKLEPDSSETEYTEDELPALTIFLKKETQVDHEHLPKKQRHDLTATKYYGVAVTNQSKIVLGKFNA